MIDTRDDLLNKLQSEIRANAVLRAEVAALQAQLCRAREVMADNTKTFYDRSRNAEIILREEGMSRYDAPIQYLGEISDLKRGIVEMKKEVLLRDEKIAVLRAEVAALQGQVCRAREALQIYANDSEWECDVVDIGVGNQRIPGSQHIFTFGPDLAKEALSSSSPCAHEARLSDAEAREKRLAELLLEASEGWPVPNRYSEAAKAAIRAK
jgi:hypothetical protein